MSWPGAILTAPAGQVIADDGPGLEVKPAPPVSLPTPAVVVGAEVVVVASSVVVVLAGFGFLGLRTTFRLENSAELTCMPACCRRSLSFASTLGKITSAPTTRASRPTGRPGCWINLRRSKGRVALR
jgi:hypothetical protein